MYPKDHSIWVFRSQELIFEDRLEPHRLRCCGIRVFNIKNNHDCRIMEVLPFSSISLKSLRAFRILRPLRSINAIPSKSFN